MEMTYGHMFASAAGLIALDHMGIFKKSDPRFSELSAVLFNVSYL